MFTLSEAKKKLQSTNQDHLLDYYPHLSKDQQQQLLKKIDLLDIHLLNNLIASLKITPPFESYTPLKTYEKSGNPHYYKLGLQALRQNKMGCILIAGGQGTRLGFKGPKGLFPISPIRKKTLFQIVAEKTKAASKLANQNLYLAIMTSPNNHEETVRHFYDNQFFGLDPIQLDFFTQPEWPLLDENHQLFLDETYSIAYGANGNGACLNSFYHAGLFKKWHKEGIEVANLIFIDNPLSDPFDCELLGYYNANPVDIIIKAILRDSADEKVGLIAQDTHGIRIIEYTEIPEKIASKQDSDGIYEYPLANTGMFCLSMNFIKKIANKPLPIHIAIKKFPKLYLINSHFEIKQTTVYKFEEFLFDILHYADQTSVLVYPRRHCFSPIKNNEGPSSPITAQADIQNLDRWLLEQITDKPVPKGTIELAAEFYYPTDALRQKWKGRSVQVGYIKA